MKNILLFIFTLFSSYSFAVSNDTKNKSQNLKFDIYTFEKVLHPSQFQIGELVIQNKISLMLRMKKKELNKYLKSKVIPVILGPDQKYWMIDRHHTSRALIEIRVKKDLYGLEVIFELREDWSHLSFNKFYYKMLESKYIYSKIDGEDVDPSQIPSDLGSLTNDIFRSLSWLLREAGAYAKVSVPFLEFVWGDFLRNNIVITGGEIVENDLKKSIEYIFDNQNELMSFPGFIPLEFNSLKSRKKKLKKMIKKVKKYL